MCLTLHLSCAYLCVVFVDSGTETEYQQTRRIANAVGQCASFNCCSGWNVIATTPMAGTYTVHCLSISVYAKNCILLLDQWRIQAYAATAAASIGSPCIVACAYWVQTNAFIATAHWQQTCT